MEIKDIIEELHDILKFATRKPEVMPDMDGGAVYAYACGVYKAGVSMLIKKLEGKDEN